MRIRKWAPCTPLLYGSLIAVANFVFLRDARQQASKHSGITELKTKDATNNSLTKDESGELANLGELFFEDSRSSIRRACTQVDKLGPPLGYRKLIGRRSLNIFKTCMQKLEAAQELIRRKAPNRRACDKPQVFLHSVWDGPLQETTKLGLVSSVYAHGPGCAQLTVHTSGSTTEMEKSLKQYLGSHVTVSKVNATHLMDIIVKQFPDLKPMATEKAAFVASLDQNPPELRKTKYANLIRILALAAYGGVYLDSDVLVLNSLIPLQQYGKDYWYRWSTQHYCNNAVLSFAKGSPAAHMLIQRILELGDPAEAIHSCHCKQMTPLIGNLVEMLPSAYFDASWVMVDHALQSTQNYAGSHYGVQFFGKDFFRAKEKALALEEFFPGSFAYHWHNNYGDDFGNNSVAETFRWHFEQLKESKEYLM